MTHIVSFSVQSRLHKANLGDGTWESEAKPNHKFMIKKVMHPEHKFSSSMSELNLHLPAFPSLRFVLTSLRLNLKGEIKPSIPSMQNDTREPNLSPDLSFI